MNDQTNFEQMMKEEMEKVAREHFAKQDAEEEEQALIELAAKLGKTREETVAYLKSIDGVRQQMIEFLSEGEGIRNYLTPEKTFDEAKFRADCETMIFLARQVFEI